MASSVSRMHHGREGVAVPLYGLDLGHGQGEDLPSNSEMLVIERDGDHFEPNTFDWEQLDVLPCENRHRAPAAIVDEMQVSALERRPWLVVEPPMGLRRDPVFDFILENSTRRASKRSQLGCIVSRLVRVMP